MALRLRTWRIAVRAGLVVVGLVAVTSQALADLPASARQAQQVLRNRCQTCHGPDGSAEGKFDFLLDRGRLLSSKLVVPGQPDQSPLYLRVASGEMPKGGPTLSQEEQQTLRTWIEGGAADFRPIVARRRAISPHDVARSIREDLQRQAVDRRRGLRYFTLAHLHNAGASDEELRIVRQGLSRLINSLSWSQKIVPPRPIDPAETVLRIDLGDYEWSSTTWERIVKDYPFGVLLGTDDFRRCQELAGFDLPYVRADWFIHAAARPPLYHDVLELPQTLTDLELKLGIDSLANLAQRTLVRAGFNNSGVSANNRLIERHATRYGAYWRSYDFRGNLERANLFEHPLEFHADGGEAIFNLPNGLQGYMLVDAAGQRIDAGPTDIVSDPHTPTRAVINGISCMTCHSQGVIDKTDQLRDHAQRFAESFDANTVATVATLHPPADQFAELLRQDRNRFRAAAHAAGAPGSTSDPVYEVSRRYEGDVDLAAAAAECDRPPDRIHRMLKHDQALARRLGPLTLGQAVPRQVFEKAFGELATGPIFNPTRPGWWRKQQQEEKKPIEPQNFAGVWSVDGRPQDRITIFQAAEGAVVGRHSTGILHGKVEGDKLTYQWTKPDGTSGPGQWTMTQPGLVKAIVTAADGVTVNSGRRQRVEAGGIEKPGPLDAFLGLWVVAGDPRIEFEVSVVSRGTLRAQRRRSTTVYAPVEGSLIANRWCYTYTNNGGGIGEWVLQPDGAVVSRIRSTRTPEGNWDQEQTFRRIRSDAGQRPAGWNARVANGQ